MNKRPYSCEDCYGLLRCPSGGIKHLIPPMPTETPEHMMLREALELLDNIAPPSVHDTRRKYYWVRHNIREYLDKK